MPYPKKGECRNTGKTHFPKGHIPWINEKHHTKKSKEKISVANRNQIPWNKGTKTGIGGNKTIGRIPWNKGKMHYQIQGKKHPNWQGGKSFEPYTTDWTETLKRSIRERDHYTCQLCSKLQEDFVHDVHHIDYVKKNCDPKNLITLCHSCNSKVNFNRSYWMLYFKIKTETALD